MLIHATLPCVMQKLCQVLAVKQRTSRLVIVTFSHILTMDFRINHVDVFSEEESLRAPGQAAARVKALARFRW